VGARAIVLDVVDDLAVGLGRLAADREDRWGGDQPAQAIGPRRERTVAICSRMISCKPSRSTRAM
jgi:hypothetical protein